MFAKRKVRVVLELLLFITLADSVNLILLLSKYIGIGHLRNILCAIIVYDITTFQMRGANEKDVVTINLVLTNLSEGLLKRKLTNAQVIVTGSIAQISTKN